ncbi:ABC transporter substrate-binding protein [Buchananella felis]|uniref:ABC transporter substrate-binding protein n=1 Tax=Buchananella felis TaxID=3231492 RepID=UPI003527D73A
MNRKFALPAAAAAIALLVSGCASSETPAADSGASGTSATGDVRFDVSTVKAVPELAELVPPAVKEAGVLRVGASTDYAPAEFRAEDGQTPVGYDVELAGALAAVLGLKVEVTHAQFDSIIPAIGTKFDAGISSFTITDERTDVTNMIAYINVGSSYAVQTGNPKSFDPTNVCGSRIGVLTGSYQQEYLEKLNQNECKAKVIDVAAFDQQTEATTNLASGLVDAFLADSTVSGYAVTLTDGALEVVGDVIEAEPQGIIVAQDDAALTEALAKAMQHLMDDGTWTKILTAWGSGDAALSTAEVFSK